MTFGEFINKYNIQLNEQQLAAVKSVEKPTPYSGGARGSGKTRVSYNKTWLHDLLPWYRA